MRVKTGVNGMDELIEGGLIKNHIYLVAGPPGSGRTTFGIQFLVQGALENEKCLYVALTETPTNVIKNMSRFKFNLIDHVKQKHIFFMNATEEIFESTSKKAGPKESEIFDLTAEPTPTKDIFDKIEPIIKKTGITRLVIDSTTALTFLTKSKESEAKQLAKYINTIKQLEVTTIILSENLDPNGYGFQHYLSNGIILLHHFPAAFESDLPRALQILKMRGTRHDIILHHMGFTDNGLEIRPNIERKTRRKSEKVEEVEEQEEIEFKED
jgi:KaiC/GvpD/RAD55 family RecA-like ATPase